MIVRTGVSPECQQQLGLSDWQLWSSFLKTRFWPVTGEAIREIDASLLKVKLRVD
jgi:hypothetical protein